MYLRVLNVRSYSTDPGTITITSSASLIHSPNRSRAPKRLMGRNVLHLALESGWADAAVNLEPVLSVHPSITQPVLALGLSLRGWMFKPLSLELVWGPMGL